MMLEKKIFISTLVTITVLVFSPINIFASNTTTGSTTTKAGVTVAAGKLSIKSVPNSLSFSSTVGAIANGSGKIVATNTLHTAVKTTDDLGYGSDTHWTLTATPSELTYTSSDKATHNLNVASLTIAGKTITTLDGKNAINVATGTNEGSTSTPIYRSNTSIKLNRDNQVYGQSYTGTITWTLTETAGTTTCAAS